MPTSIASTFAPSSAYRPARRDAVRPQRIVDTTRVTWVVCVLVLAALGLAAAFAPTGPADLGAAIGLVAGP